MALADELVAFAETFWTAALQFWPYFLFAVILGVLLNMTRLDRRVVGFFDRGGPRPILGAILLGAVSPL
ncbi:MAG: hypothetical protein HY691_20710 [Chloroflexi bacterium]|nr:hypothetical protein [Chloroflexota bacterium]